MSNAFDLREGGVMAARGGDEDRTRGRLEATDRVLIDESRYPDGLLN